jgi:hypothetical protein
MVVVIADYDVVIRTMSTGRLRSISIGIVAVYGQNLPVNN